MFEQFQDYMYHLLVGPLKKIFKKNNQFYILFKVAGKLFDQTKKDIFRVRQESMIISASEKLLNEHGRDRTMPRLKGESVENYRVRLSMKNIIAEMAGTNEGILLALKALGYERSYIEPFYIHDDERWAEFIIYLSSKNPSSINDIRVIDNEVMKVKPSGGLPSYGAEENSRVVIRSNFETKVSNYPLCNMVICGEWPSRVNIGKVFGTNNTLLSKNYTGGPDYPLCGITQTKGDDLF